MRKILLLISFLIYSASSFILGGTTGKLSGKVVDADTKEPMPFVNIILMGTNFGAASDLDGNYVMLNIPPGKYTVRAQSIGYQPMEYENVSISIDLTTNLDFELQATAVELEAIVVESRQDFVKKDVTSSQSLISSDQIQALPVSEFDDVLQFQAGVTKDADGDFH
ncbi:MAG: carboxypeptidase-like regulatory domain-containing protein, partial [Ignavibacteria bacterium]